MDTSWLEDANNRPAWEHDSGSVQVNEEGGHDSFEVDDEGQLSPSLKSPLVIVPNTGAEGVLSKAFDKSSPSVGLDNLTAVLPPNRPVDVLGGDFRPPYFGLSFANPFDHDWFDSQSRDEERSPLPVKAAPLLDPDVPTSPAATTVEDLPATVTCSHQDLHSSIEHRANTQEEASRACTLSNSSEQSSPADSGAKPQLTNDSPPPSNPGRPPSPSPITKETSDTSIQPLKPSLTKGNTVTRTSPQKSVHQTAKQRIAARSHSILCKPFRSPMMDQKATSLKRGLGADVADKESPTKRRRTGFKLPSLNGVSSPRKPNSLDAQINELQEKIRTLKQAIKYKKEDEANPLQDLIDLWRQKGQEAATELFSKFPAPDPELGMEANPYGQPTQQTSWGWADETEGNQAHGQKFREEENDAVLRKGITGRSLMQEHQEEARKAEQDALEAQSALNEKQPVAWNIGCMLDRCGLTKELLKWDEEAEDFA